MGPRVLLLLAAIAASPGVAPAAADTTGCEVSAPSTVVNGLPQFCAETAGVVANGGICTPQCADGYTPSPSQVTCALGELSPPTYTCHEKACPMPIRTSSVADADHPAGVCHEYADTATEVPSGSNCTAKCGTGYTPTLEVLQCRRGVLTPNSFNCVESPCIAPVGVPNATTPACLEGHIIDHLGRCTPQCEAGLGATPPPRTNVPGFRWFRFTVTSVRGRPTEKFMQITELWFLQNGQYIDLGDAEFFDLGSRSLVGEGPKKAIDGDLSTMWVQEGFTPILVKFSDLVFLDTIRFTTASNKPERDPVRWKLEASTDGELWTRIHFQGLDYATPTARRQLTNALPTLRSPFGAGDSVRVSADAGRVHMAFDQQVTLTWSAVVPEMLGKVFVVQDVPKAGILTLPSPEGGDLRFPTEAVDGVRVLHCSLGVLFPSTFECTSLACNAPAAVDGSALPSCEEGWSVEHGARCTAACSVGHNPAMNVRNMFGQTVRAVLNCTLGNLTPSTFDCQQGRCIALDPLTIDNVHPLMGTCQEGYTIDNGQLCTAMCDEGYTANKEFLFCNDGELAPATYECLENPCAAPTNVEYALTPACVEGNEIPPGICTPRCMEGFKPSLRNLTCNKGVLVPSSFVCVPLPCYLSDGLEGSCLEPMPLDAGGNCTTVCPIGKKPSVAFLECIRSNFTPPTFTCVNISCSASSVVNGADPSCLEGSVRNYSEVCTPQCRFGYTASEDALVCNETTLFDPPTFECIGKPCDWPNADAIDHVAVDESGKRSPCLEPAPIPHGWFCTPQCEPGYEPLEESLQCSASRLSPATFTCVETVVLGKAQSVEDDTFHYGTAANLVVADLGSSKQLICYEDMKRMRLSCAMVIVSLNSFRMHENRTDDDILIAEERVRSVAVAALGPDRAVLCFVSRAQPLGRCLLLFAEGLTIQRGAEIEIATGGVVYHPTLAPFVEPGVSSTDLVMLCYQRNSVAATCRLLSVCQDFDVRLTSVYDSFGSTRGTPELFMSGGFHPMCTRGFASNDNGAAIFCQSLGATGGRVIRSNGVANSGTYSFDAIAMNACGTGHASIADCGGGSFHSSCKAGYDVKFDTSCTGITSVSPLTSCSSKAPGFFVAGPELDVLHGSTMYLSMSPASAGRTLLCLVDAALGRQGRCFLIGRTSPTGMTIGIVDQLLVNGGPTAHLALAKLPNELPMEQMGSSIICFADWSQGERGHCGVLRVHADADEGSLRISNLTTVAEGMARYLRLVSLSSTRALAYYQLSSAVGDLPAVVNLLTVPSISKFATIGVRGIMANNIDADSGPFAMAYHGAALSSDGRVVFAPYNAHKVGVFDPNAGTFVLFGDANLVAGRKRYMGAATAANGKVVFAPADADAVGVFNPAADTFATVDISSQISCSQSASGCGKFRGAAATSNGKVVFAPYRAPKVGVFDANDNSFRLVNANTNDFGPLLGNGWYSAAVVASNGKVVFAPADAQKVAVFNVDQNRIEAFVDVLESTGSSHGVEWALKFVDAAALPGGRVVFCPGFVPYVGIFDSMGNQFTMIGIAGHVFAWPEPPSLKYSSAVALAGGDVVVFAPCTGTSAGVLDVTSGAFKEIDAVMQFAGGYFSAAATLDERIVLAPAKTDAVGILDLGASSPDDSGGVFVSAETHVNGGVSWSLAMSKMTGDTALACFADTSQSENGRCRVVWSPSYALPDDRPLVCHRGPTSEATGGCG